MKLSENTQYHELELLIEKVQQGLLSKGHDLMVFEIPLQSGALFKKIFRLSDLQEILKRNSLHDFVVKLTQTHGFDGDLSAITLSLSHFDPEYRLVQAPSNLRKFNPEEQSIVAIEAEERLHIANDEQGAVLKTAMHTAFRGQLLMEENKYGDLNKLGSLQSFADFLADTEGNMSAELAVPCGPARSFMLGLLTKLCDTNTLILLSTEDEVQSMFRVLTEEFQFPKNAVSMPSPSSEYDESKIIITTYDKHQLLFDRKNVQYRAQIKNRRLLLCDDVLPALVKNQWKTLQNINAVFKYCVKVGVYSGKRPKRGKRLEVFDAKLAATSHQELIEAGRSVPLYIREVSDVIKLRELSDASKRTSKQHALLTLITQNQTIPRLLAEYDNLKLRAQSEGVPLRCVVVCASNLEAKAWMEEAEAKGISAGLLQANSKPESPKIKNTQVPTMFVAVFNGKNTELADFNCVMLATPFFTDNEIMQIAGSVAVKKGEKQYCHIVATNWCFEDDIRGNKHSRSSVRSAFLSVEDEQAVENFCLGAAGEKADLSLNEKMDIRAMLADKVHDLEQLAGRPLRYIRCDILRDPKAEVTRRFIAILRIMGKRSNPKQYKHGLLELKQIFEVQQPAFSDRAFYTPEYCALALTQVLSQVDMQRSKNVRNDVYNALLYGPTEGRLRCSEWYYQSMKILGRGLFHDFMESIVRIAEKELSEDVLNKAKELIVKARSTI